MTGSEGFRMTDGEGVAPAGSSLQLEPSVPRILEPRFSVCCAAEAGIEYPHAAADESFAFG